MSTGELLWLLKEFYAQNEERRGFCGSHLHLSICIPIIEPVFGLARATQDTYYDKTKVDDLRRKYAKVCFFPERGQHSEDSRRRQILDTARLLGFADDRIKRIEEALARYERVDEALDEIRKLESNSYKPANEKTRQTNAHEAKNTGNMTKVVRGEQGLVKSLNEGWELVKELSNDKFLLKKGFDQYARSNLSRATTL
jgi:hypothetical protein